MSQLTEADRRGIEKLRRELGPVAPLLTDGRIEDICLNPDGRVWVKRLGARPVHECDLSPTAAESAIGTVAAIRKAIVNHDSPILETEVPGDGSRFEALLAPCVAAPVFSLRRRAGAVFSLDEYSARGILQSREHVSTLPAPPRQNFARYSGLSHIQILKAAIRERLNILVIGATGSGKTTLVNALLQEIAVATPEDRVIVMEDTLELQTSSPNSACLRTAENVSMDRLLKATMRLRPNRIIVGEVRDGAALSLLKAWNTGHPGGISTIHANDAAAGLIRLNSLCAEATQAPQERLIAEAVNLVVFIDEFPNTAGRLVREIRVVHGYDGHAFQTELL
jgi:Flp pilus assembly CpaF family ATPase